MTTPSPSLPSTPPSVAPEPERRTPRIVGQRRGAEAGPTLVVVGGVHGNERAGLHAAERVLAALEGDDHGLCGELLFLSGNRAAIDRSVRYQVKDLNRQWTPERCEALRAGAIEDAEDLEQRELLETIEAAFARARGDVYVMDLHTTSAAGTPFVIFGDTLRQRRFGLAFPLPIILGLEETIDGVMSAYFSERGCIALAIEGGQHTDPASIDNLEACLWVALVAAGLTRAERTPRLGASRSRLEELRRDLPRVMEVLSRHAIRDEDRFVMEPGFANLDWASRDQLLATDARGEIRAPSRGLVMLPLYQGLGSDGFFWGRAVGRTRMRLSGIVRRLGLARLLPLLPGVRRDPAHPDRLLADTRIARLYPLDVFHVFGYRRIRQVGDVLHVARRG